MSLFTGSLRQTAPRWPLAIVRILYGHMWLGTSLAWLRTPDRAASLSQQVRPLLENGRATDWYQPFLGQVVLAHASLFASLVTAGEAFVALSLLFGLATRLGAGVAMFLTLNYSLLYGQSFLSPAGNTLDFWVSFLLLGGAAGRVWGADSFLQPRWPRLPIW